MAREIVLALGGGGVRGIAHLGVLKCLEEHDYQIKGIAGTSAGGLFGSLYAAGTKIDDILPLVGEFFTKPNFRRASTDKPSLVGTSGIEASLRKLLGERNIEDFPIAFAATAVSLKTGDEMVLDKGPAVDAVLSTIAIPGLFPSRGEEDEYLVDGGILDPVPIRAARRLNSSLPVVAVVLHRKPADFSPRHARLPLSDSIPQPIFRQLSRTRMAEAFQTFYASLEVITDRLTEQDLVLAKPDVIVSPLVGQFSMLEKVDPDELIAYGYKAMSEELEKLEESLSLINAIKRITKYTEAKS
ncbi:MAG: patatin-like phospholipase family protein [Anaerolineaceae bacterium]|nr:patatin-like phospholipase family protein [Anaerolineaceae bacterium]HPT23993.1 patatin-like phospholipase family protein [Anaerolineaceae bacterium]